MSKRRRFKFQTQLYSTPNKPTPPKEQVVATHVHGIVKSFRVGSGYGFILPENGTKEVFFNCNELQGHKYSAVDGSGRHLVLVGERVEFDIVQTPAGRQARNVVRVEIPKKEVEQFRRGEVLFYNSERKYGNIVDDDGSIIFVHQSAIIGNKEKTLFQGDKVTYKIGQDRDGKLCAKAVFVVKGDR